MTAKQKIAEYKFEDAIGGVNAIIGLHVFFFMIFFLFSLGQISHGRSLMCIVVALVYLVALKYYDWMSYRINALLIGLYVSLCIVEWGFLGMPFIGYLEDNYMFNKGVMLDFFIAMIPYIYVGLRLGLIIPLLSVTVRAKQVIGEATV